MLTNIFPKQPADGTNYVSGLTGSQIALVYTVYHLVKHH
jgi:hypothetical protein